MFEFMVLFLIMLLLPSARQTWLFNSNPITLTPLPKILNEFFAFVSLNLLRLLFAFLPSTFDVSMNSILLSGLNNFISQSVSMLSKLFCYIFNFIITQRNISSIHQFTFQ